MWILKILVLSLLVWVIPTASHADTVHFDLAVAKQLYIDLKFYKLDSVHKVKQLEIIKATNESLSLYNADLLKLDAENVAFISTLDTQIQIQGESIETLTDDLYLWEQEAERSTKKLVKCLDKPWYYIHFPSAGMGALLTALLVLL